MEFYKFIYPDRYEVEMTLFESEEWYNEILKDLLVKKPNKCIDFIKKYQIDPNKVIDGEYLLYWAVLSNNYDLIEYLIDHGADIDRVIESLELAEEIDIETLKIRKYKKIWNKCF